MSKTFHGKTAFVTGGNSGIGRATAIEFAKEGARVVIAARRANKCREVVDAIHNIGGEAFFMEGDITRGDEVRGMIGTVIETYGSLDFAFNNAGITLGGGKSIHELEEEIWDSVMDTNLKGVYLCMKYEIEMMLDQGGGVIINNSSGFGLTATTRRAAYVCSKHAVIGLTKAAALEYAQNGIRVNAVCPGYVTTPMTQDALDRPELRARMIARQPTGRTGEPEEVAKIVTWLCSDSASFVTGHSMLVDGGALAGLV